MTECKGQATSEVIRYEEDVTLNRYPDGSKSLTGSDAEVKGIFYCDECEIEWVTGQNNEDIKNPIGPNVKLVTPVAIGIAKSAKERYCLKKNVTIVSAS